MCSLQSTTGKEGCVPVSTFHMCRASVLVLFDRWPFIVDSSSSVDLVWTSPRVHRSLTDRQNQYSLTLVSAHSAGRTADPLSIISIQSMQLRLNGRHSRLMPSTIPLQGATGRSVRNAVLRLLGRIAK